MNWKLFLVFLLTIAGSFCQQVLNEGVNKGINIPSASPSTTELAFDMTTNGSDSDSLSFTVFPCFGSFDWYSDWDRVPNVTDPVGQPCVNKWMQSQSETNCVFNDPSSGNYYVVAVGTTSVWSANPSVAGTFDILVYNTPTLLSDLVPVPGNNGVISVQSTKADSSDGTASVSISWTGTGNPNDNYTVMQYPGTIASNSGYSTYTGCGVQYFMTPVDQSHLTMEQNNEALSATISELDSKAIITLSVLIQRAGGYISVYEPLNVNGAGTIAPLFSLLFFLLFWMF